VWGAIGRSVPTVNLFWVSVPVLSLQRMSTGRLLDRREARRQYPFAGQLLSAQGLRKGERGRQSDRNRPDEHDQGEGEGS